MQITQDHLKTDNQLANLTLMSGKAFLIITMRMNPPIITLILNLKPHSLSFTLSSLKMLHQMPLSTVLKKLKSTQNSGPKSETTLWLEIARNTESRARKIPCARNGLSVIALGNQELELHLVNGSVRIAVLSRLSVGCHVWSLNKM